jgi:uncharacterized protein
LLRGPQTPGELKARSERMADLRSLEDVERTLRTLVERGYARRLDRRPGQKEDRFEHLLGSRADDQAVAPASAEPRPHESVSGDRIEARVEALEAQVASLREQLALIRDSYRPVS